MNKNEYTNKALELLKNKYPTYNFLLGTEEDLLLTYDASEKKDFPRNLYLNTPYHKSDGTQFINVEEDILEFCEDAFSIDTSFLDTQFEDVKNKILPQIKTNMQIEYTHKDVTEEKKKLVTTPLTENLVVAYVVDQLKGFLYITGDYLEKWKITTNDIDQIAMNNLLKTNVTQRGPDTLTTDDGQVFYVFESKDGYDASRILLKIMHSFFAEQMPEGYVIGIPHRDILICAPKSNSEAVQKFVQELYNDNPHPIFPGIFSFDGAKPEQVENNPQ